MLFLPYSLALDLTKKPLVTYGVILLCIILHQFQWNNRHDIESRIQEYCFSIKHSQSPDGTVDVLRQRYGDCKYLLEWMHTSPERDVITNGIRPALKSIDATADTDVAQAIHNANNHYDILKEQLPASLDGMLMYYPDDFNLLRMITATFAHGSWLHVIGNLLFFFAFAQGVEGVINNRLKYSAFIISLTFICQIAYTVYCSGINSTVPTLGLSGVVMGMMGASLYLMPHARIKVFIWGYRFVNTYYIPAWILAVVYLGWDTLDLYVNGQQGGVNLVAHVSGGFTGIIIAMLFFAEQRRVAKEELAEETDYQVSRKKDGNSYDLSSKYGRVDMANRFAVKQSVKEHNDFMQKIYTLVNVQRDSEAINLLIGDYAQYEQDYGVLEQLFNRIGEWGNSRTLLCTGRMLIDLLLNIGQYARAVNVLKQCQKITQEFVLADADMASLLVRYAIEIKEYDVAYLLVHNAEVRYDKSVDVTRMKLREAELCFVYLAKPEQGKALMEQLLKNTDPVYKADILSLAKLYQMF